MNRYSPLRDRCGPLKCGFEKQSTMGWDH